ncbi:mannitol dehydrogenase family protein [Kineococcus sp. SYSU DK002]|uniref:hypothetical protein n=1 Tax=Kineococcus sp. SYSU DK002 TaxID=3383123 RepID=UPI003D7F0D9B
MTTRAPSTHPVPRDVPLDPALLTPAVVHLGAHGLRRAYHAVYVDELLRRGVSTDWGLVRIELLPPDVELDLDAVRRREVLTDPPREVVVLADHVCLTGGCEDQLAVLADPATRLVLVDVEVDVEVDDPLARTAVGYLVGALARRRAAGEPPFTALSCAAGPRNGSRLREAVLRLARDVDGGLAAWVEARGSFPSSVCEPLLPGGAGCPRWIVEDDFSDGRPPLDDVGVQLVPSTVPHELLRGRLHDAAFDVLAVQGALRGDRTAGAALARPGARALLEGFLAEAGQQLLGFAEDELAGYRRNVVADLARDPGRELPAPGRSRFCTDVLPSLRQAVDHDGPRRWLVQALADWLRVTSDGPGDAVDLLRRQHHVLGPLADEHRLTTELQQALDLLPPSPSPTTTPVEFS